MRFNDKEDIIQLTPLWKGERFDDGRPRVPDHVLTRIERVTIEQAWSVLWRSGYRHQFQSEWRIVHPDRVLVGRAVTANMVPMRPDLHDYLLEYGQREEGRRGFFNAWVIETLVEDDVIVVDLFDKIFEGTFSGGNLSTAIAARTKKGQIIYGGIRDLQQIGSIENLQTYYRGVDPTPIRDVTLTGMNVPCRIGSAICMPGDVVLGTSAGVLFIPPHLAEKCVIEAEKERLRDVFGFERLREGKYTPVEIDGDWSSDIERDFAEWRKANTPEELMHLTWENDDEGKREI